MSQLRIARYERVQSVSEHFSNYVQAIKDAALVFRIGDSEAQVVDRVVEGLTLTQRARFVFQPPPSSIRQLELCDRGEEYRVRRPIGSGACSGSNDCGSRIADGTW